MKGEAIEGVQVNELDLSLDQIDLSDIVRLKSDSLLSEAVSLMSSKKIGSLIISDDKNGLGIITEKDFILNSHLFNNNDYEGLKINDFVSYNLITLSMKDSLKNVICKMADYQIRHIPVISEKSNDILKMISASDVIKYFVNIFSKAFDSLEVILPDNIGHFSEIHGEDFTISNDQFSSTISTNFLDLPLKQVTDSKNSSLDISTSVGSCIEVMRREKLEIITIVEYETRLKGVITERDLLNKVFMNNNFDFSAPVSSIMTYNPDFLFDSHSIANAIKNMSSRQYRHVIISDDDRIPHYTISIIDILKYFNYFISR